LETAVSQENTMPLTNNVTLLFPPQVRVFVQALTNAAAVQTVTLHPPSGTDAVFKGSGEGNVQANLATPGFLTVPGPGGQANFVTPAAGGAYKVTINSSLGANRVTGGKLATGNPDGGDFGLAWVISEDSTDKDFNDAVVLFTYYSNSAPI
jgi:hypothetical protein